MQSSSTRNEKLSKPPLRVERLEDRLLLAYGLVDTILPELGPISGGRSGTSLALTPEYRVVSSPWVKIDGVERAGIVSVYNDDNELLFQIDQAEPFQWANFGNQVAVDGDNLVVLSGGQGFVYQLSNSGASYLTELEVPSSLAYGQVAIHENIVVVGAPRGDVFATDAGEVYVYDLGDVDGTGVLEHSIMLADPTPSELGRFGMAIDIQGTVVAVSSNGEDFSGEVYVYDIGGLPDGTVSSNPVVTVVNSQIGQSRIGSDVELNGSQVATMRRHQQGQNFEVVVFDIDVAAQSVVSTPNFQIRSPNPDDVLRDFDWDGDRIAIGADDSLKGVVHVYDVSGAATGSIDDSPEFSLVNNLSGTDPGSSLLGFTVAIQGDEVLVGNPADSTFASFAGVAQLFDLAGQSNGSPIATLFHVGPVFGGSFGSRLAEADGWLLARTSWIIGGECFGVDSFAMHQIGEAASTPIDYIREPRYGCFTSFGGSIDSDGETVAVGSVSGTSNWEGAVFVFDISSTAPVLLARLASPNSPGHGFGQGVAIEGDEVVVSGASGQVYVYDLNDVVPGEILDTPKAQLTIQGASRMDVQLDDQRLYVSEPYASSLADSAGAFHVFDMTTSAPQFLTTIHNPSPDEDDQFASSMVLHNQTLAVSGQNGDNGVANSGIVYLYDLTSGLPVQASEWESPAPQDSDWFGSGIGLNEDKLVVGAPGYDDAGGEDSGVAYVFDLAAGNGAVPDVISNPGPSEGDRFGEATLISQDRIYISAIGDDESGRNAGAVYAFEPDLSALNCDYVGAIGCDIDDLNSLYAGTDGAPTPITDTLISQWLLDASDLANPLKPMSTTTFVPGDVNLDGSVTSLDLGRLLNNFGDTSGLGWGDGNLNSDPNVDSEDLGLLLNDFGFQSSPPAAGIGQVAPSTNDQFFAQFAQLEFEEEDEDRGSESLLQFHL